MYAAYQRQQSDSLPIRPKHSVPPQRNRLNEVPAVSKDVGEQEPLLTGIQLRSSANRKGRDRCSRRSLRDEVYDVRDAVEIMGEDLKGRRSRGTTEVVMTLRQHVNGRKKHGIMNYIAPVFLMVSLTLWVVAQLTTSLASWAPNIAIP